MVQIIGFMIGLYIIVRMISFITRGGDRKEDTIVKVAATLLIIITFFLLLGLLATDGTLPK